jgi:hypothetical protein
VTLNHVWYLQPSDEGFTSRLRPCFRHHSLSLLKIVTFFSLNVHLASSSSKGFLEKLLIIGFYFRSNINRNIANKEYLPRHTMNFIHSTLDKVREWAPVSNTSTFRQNGQITPDEFLAAGDYLVHMFPMWSWADASPVSKRANYLPAGKQFLVIRGVPCHRRLDENFAGDAGHDETMVGDGEDFKSAGGHAPGDDEDGWLRTGGLAASQEARARDVRTVDESGNMGEREEDEDEIPDMEDDDDEDAIIRDSNAEGTDSYDVPQPSFP